jgi:hypothetical protein
VSARAGVCCFTSAHLDARSSAAGSFISQATGAPASLLSSVTGRPASLLSSATGAAVRDPTCLRVIAHLTCAPQQSRLSSGAPHSEAS